MTYKLFFSAIIKFTLGKVTYTGLYGIVRRPSNAQNKFDFSSGIGDINVMIKIIEMQSHKNIIICCNLKFLCDLCEV